MVNLPLILSIAFFTAFIVYGVFSVYILHINWKSALHRAFFAVCIALCIWSLGSVFGASAPNMNEALFWRRFAVFGWGSAFSFILHFILVLTGRRALLKKWWLYVLLYAPAAASICIFAIPNQMDFVPYNLVPTNMGWVNIASNAVFNWFYNICYGGFFIVGVMLLWLWGRRALDVRVKKQAHLIFGAFLAAVLVGTAADMALPSYFSVNTPQFVPLILLFPVAVANYSIGRYGLMQFQAPEEVSILNVSSRSVLYTYVSAIGMIGGLAYIAAGYFYNAPDVGSIYAFGLVLISLGVVVGIIRRLKIKDNYKDIVNISLITASIPIVTLRFVDNAGVTVWAFPAIMIVFSLVFNKRYVLIALTFSILLTQVAVWILAPVKEVTIDAVDHIVRLGILGAAIFIAFYVNRIYIARLNENKQKMDLQRILSQVSSDFVLANETTLEGSINTALDKCGRFTGMDRVFVMLFDTERKTMTYRYEWCADGICPEIGSFYNVPFEQYPWLTDRICSGETLRIMDIQALPPQGHFEMLELFSFGVSAMVIVPIRSKDKYFGFLAAVSSAKSREIAKDVLMLFEVVANIFSGAFTKVAGQRTVNEMAFYDHLTKLPNKSLFKDRVTQAIYLAQRTGKMIGILFLDLDSFKNVNDTLGHEGGDELIKKIAQVLSQNVRRSDTVSRFGGDEFMIMINNLSSAEDIIRTADGFMKLFNKNFRISQQEFFVTASAGIAIYPVDGVDTETLIKNADIAMYSAKARGKNRYVLCTEAMKQKVRQKARITNHLYRALDRGELMVYYQPQVSLPDGGIVGTEALLRWNHPEMGMVPPAIFIPLAEQTGLINSIGEWVLKTACLQNQKWQQMGLPRIRMAVNVSVNQFRNPHMMEQVKNILEETGLKPECLELEITESVAINESSYIIDVLNNLKSLGISISMDDFGTDYSSLSRLKLLPIDRLKMDMQFVRGIESGSKDQAIAKVIISLAKNLGLKVIAEGVETEIQKEFLAEKMCDEAQGFYFYKPAPAEEVEAILRAAARQPKN